MAQAARRLTDAVDGFLASHRILICDRDSKWTDDFRRIVQDAGVRIVLIPVRAPNANAYAERFVHSIREECFDRLILFGERRLLRALDEFVAHYHGERNHRGLGNALIVPQVDASCGHRVRCLSDGAGSCATTTTPLEKRGLSFRTSLSALAVSSPRACRCGASSRGEPMWDSHSDFGGT